MGFEAKYGGRCTDCGNPIHIGDLIRYDDDRVVHDFCDSVPVDERPGEVCAKCWLVKPCVCEVF